MKRIPNQSAEELIARADAFRQEDIDADPALGIEVKQVYADLTYLLHHGDDASRLAVATRI